MTTAFDDLPGLNALADAEVRLILAKSHLLRWVNFSFDGLPIRPGLFGVVADCLQTGAMRVVCALSLGSGAAEYESDSDELRVGFTAAPTVSRQALVVHECVHAGLDAVAAGGVTVATSEAAAYIAQMVYQRVGRPDRGCPESSNASKQAVWDWAWWLAGEVIASRPLDPADCEAMRSAVRQHPKYRNAAHRTADFDGV